MGDHPARRARPGAADGTRSALVLLRHLAEEDDGGSETVQAVGLVAFFGAVLGGLVLNAATPVAQAVGQLFETTVAAVGFEGEPAQPNQLDPTQLDPEQIEAFQQTYLDALPENVVLDEDGQFVLPDAEASAFLRNFEDDVTIDGDGNAVATDADGTQYVLDVDGTGQQITADGVVTEVDLSSLDPGQANITSTGTVVNTDNEVVTAEGDVLATLDGDTDLTGTGIVVDPSNGNLVDTSSGQVVGQLAGDVDLSGITTSYDIGFTESPLDDTYVFDPFALAAADETEVGLGLESDEPVLSYVFAGEQSVQVASSELDGIDLGNGSADDLLLDDGADPSDATPSAIGAGIETSVTATDEGTSVTIDGFTTLFLTDDDLDLDTDVAGVTDLTDGSGVVGFWQRGEGGGLDVRISDEWLPSFLQGTTIDGSARFDEDGNFIGDLGVGYQEQYQFGDQVFTLGGNVAVATDDNLVVGGVLGIGEEGNQVLLLPTFDVDDGVAAIDITAETDALGAPLTGTLSISPEGTAISNVMLGEGDGSNVSYEADGTSWSINGQLGLTDQFIIGAGIGGEEVEGGGSISTQEVSITYRPNEDLGIEAFYGNGSATGFPFGTDVPISTEENSNTFGVNLVFDTDSPDGNNSFEVGVGTNFADSSGSLITPDGDAIELEQLEQSVDTYSVDAEYLQILGDGDASDTTPTPQPTPAPTPDPTPAPTPDPTPAPTPDPTPAPTPDPTPAPTPDPTPAPTPDPTPEPTPDPTPEPTPDPTQQPAPTPTFDPANPDTYHLFDVSDHSAIDWNAVDFGRLTTDQINSIDIGTLLSDGYNVDIGDILDSGGPVLLDIPLDFGIA